MHHVHTVLWKRGGLVSVLLVISACPSAICRQDKPRENEPVESGLICPISLCWHV